MVLFSGTYLSPPLFYHLIVLYFPFLISCVSSKLINLAVPDTIDERALNKRDTLNVYQKTENVVRMLYPFVVVFLVIYLY